MARKEPVTKIVRQLRSGQVTIPADFRRELGIDDDSLLQMTLIHGELHIKPVRVTTDTRSSAWLKELYDHFAPTRQIAAQYSDEEINADIDAAVEEVRQKHGQSSL